MSTHYFKFIYSSPPKFYVKIMSDIISIILNGYKFQYNSLQRLCSQHCEKFPILFGAGFLRRFMKDISFLQTPEKVVDFFLKGTVHAFNMKSGVATLVKLRPFLYSFWHTQFRKVGSHGCKWAWRTSGIVTWQLERYDFLLVNSELILHLRWARYFPDRSGRGRRERLGVMLR